MRQIFSRWYNCIEPESDNNSTHGRRLWLRWGEPAANHSVKLFWSSGAPKSEYATQNHRLRGYDAIHLATALTVNAALTAANLPPLIFVAADDDLLAAARAEGLATENPNYHP